VKHSTGSTPWNRTNIPANTAINFFFTFMDHLPIRQPESIQSTMQNLLAAIRFVGRTMSNESADAPEDEALKTLAADFMDLNIKAQMKEIEIVESMRHDEVRPEILRRNLSYISSLTGEFTELHDRIVLHFQDKSPGTVDYVESKTMDTLKSVVRLAGVKNEWDPELKANEKTRVSLEHLRSMLIISTACTPVLMPLIPNPIIAALVGAASAGASTFFAKCNFDIKNKHVDISEKPILKQAAYNVLNHAMMPGAMLAGAASAVSHNPYVKAASIAAVIAAPMIFDWKERVSAHREEVRQKQPSVTAFGEMLAAQIAPQGAAQNNTGESKKNNPGQSR
jgi:hypothetical protein